MYLFIYGSAGPSLRHWGQLSSLMAYGVFPDQGSNPRPWHARHVVNTMEPPGKPWIKWLWQVYKSRTLLWPPERKIQISCFSYVLTLSCHPLVKWGIVNQFLNSWIFTWTWLIWMEWKEQNSFYKRYVVSYFLLHFFFYYFYEIISIFLIEKKDLSWIMMSISSFIIV